MRVNQTVISKKARHAMRDAGDECLRSVKDNHYLPNMAFTKILEDTIIDASQVG